MYDPLRVDPNPLRGDLGDLNMHDPVGFEYLDHRKYHAVDDGQQPAEQETQGDPIVAINFETGADSQQNRGNGKKQERSRIADNGDPDHVDPVDQVADLQFDLVAVIAGISCFRHMTGELISFRFQQPDPVDNCRIPAVG